MLLGNLNINFDINYLRSLHSRFKNALQGLVEDLRKAVRLWFVQLSTWGWGLHSVFLPLYLGTSCPHHARGGVQMTGAMEDSKYFEKLSVSSYQVHVSMQYSQRYLLEWYLSTTEFNPSESLSYKGRKLIRPYFHIIHVLRSDARINETKRQWENSSHVPMLIKHRSLRMPC